MRIFFLLFLFFCTSLSAQRQTIPYITSVKAVNGKECNFGGMYISPYCLKATYSTYTVDFQDGEIPWANTGGLFGIYSQSKLTVNTNTYHIGSDKNINSQRGNLWSTLASDWINRFGYAGTVDVGLPNSSNIDWEQTCVGFGEYFQSVSTQAFLFPNSICMNGGNPNISCDVTTQDIIFDFGNVSSKDINSVELEKGININCTASAAIKVSLTPFWDGKIDLSSGRKTLLAIMTLDNKNLTQGLVINDRPGLNRHTLKARLYAQSEPAGGNYSGMAVMTISAF